MTSSKPKLILLFSGKRKSGKDYVTDLIQKRGHRYLPEDEDPAQKSLVLRPLQRSSVNRKRLSPKLCCILRLSAPLKEQYAQEHMLDYEQLLGAGHYKEQHRAEMISWGERRRQWDPGFFCRMVVCGVTQPVWIVSDCRRMSDLQWFQSEYPQQCVSVRVEASEQTRAQRGWIFTAGIDDAESECGLDQGVDFDRVIRNDGDAALLEAELERLLSLANEKTLEQPRTQDCVK